MVFLLLISTAVDGETWLYLRNIKDFFKKDKGEGLGT